MTLADTLKDSGHITIGDASLEYRMIGPRPDAAPTIVMLHEGLGSVSTWGEFPQKLSERTGAGVFVYSRAGYGKSSTVRVAAPARLHAARGDRGAACPCSTRSASGAAFCSATRTAPRLPRTTPAAIRTIA